MNQGLKKNRFLIWRRFTQVMLLVLFFIGNTLGVAVLRGNLSASRIFDSIPLADPYAVLQMIAAGTMVSVTIGLGAFTVVVFYGLIAGRAFCGWVCPMNALTDGAAWLRRRLRIPRPLQDEPAGRKVRYWVLGLGLTLSLITGVAAFEWISPVSILHRGILYGMGAGWFIVGAVFVFDLFAVKNGFCGHLCPVGGFYSLISRYSLLKVLYDKRKCTMCMKCLDICPESQVLGMIGKESALVLSGECINCGRCVDVCGEQALRFSTILAARDIKKEG